MASEQDQDSIIDLTLDSPNNLSEDQPQNETDTSMVSIQESEKDGAVEDTNVSLKDNTMASVTDTDKDEIPTKPIENDSGMASTQDSKDVTPEKPNKTLVHDESDDEDIEDETLGERLWGLTEMFPETLVNGTCYLVSGTKSGVKGLYNLTRNVLWIFFSSSAILVAPLLIEVERAQMVESQRSQEKQILLGSNPAISSNLGPNMPMMPVR